MNKPKADKTLTRKQEIFYETLVRTWTESRMELDKQLIILSSAGIGGLMYFLKDVHSCVETWLWFVAICLFLVVINFVLFIYWGNSKYIVCIVNRSEEKAIIWEERLKTVDLLAWICFLGGIISTLTLIYIQKK